MTWPTAAHTSPSLNVVLSPNRRTIVLMKIPWTIAPSTANAAKNEAVRGASKPKRAATKRPNVVWKIANANQ